MVFGGSLLDTGVGLETYWLHFLFGAIAGGITGLASALSSPWRALVGLVVVGPLHFYAADVLLGQTIALGLSDHLLMLVVSTFFTWVLPYLDPPGFVQHWSAHAGSRFAAILRKGCVYIGYGIWLYAVYMFLGIVELVINILAGYEPGVKVKPAGLFAIVSVFALSGWFLVRRWRRGKTVKAFLDTPREMTPLPEFVADAVRDSTNKPL